LLIEMVHYSDEDYSLFVDHLIFYS